MGSVKLPEILSAVGKCVRSLLSSSFHVQLPEGNSENKIMFSLKNENQFVNHSL